MRSSSLLRPAIALVLASPAALADLHVVATSGAAGAHATIQSAVDAAVDGDVVVVKNGVYPGFTVDGKSLTIVTAPSQFAAVLGESRIVNLPLGESVRLLRLEMQGQTVAHPTRGRALTITDCLGSVRIEGCNLVGANNLVHPSNCLGLLDGAGWPGLWVEDSFDVVFSHGALTGGDGLQVAYETTCWEDHVGGDGAPGVTTQGSRLALFHAQVTGGRGGNGVSGGAGATGLDVASNSVFLYGGAAQGGMGGGGLGGDFPGHGGAGGDGATFATAGVSVAVGLAAAGGAGGTSTFFQAGPAGDALSGAPASTFAGPVRDMILPASQVQSTLMKMTFVGEPHELPLVLLSPSDLWLSLSPLPALLLVAPMQVLVMPPVQANGQLVLFLPAPTLPPGIDAIAVPTQSAFLAPSGELAVGPARHVVLLAAAP